MASLSQILFHNLAYHISLTPAEEQEFLASGNTRLVKKNENLLMPGNVCRSIWFVTQGCLRIFHSDDKGEEHNLLFAPEDWWCVDMYSFHTKTPARHQISALENSELFELSHDTLEALYLTIPKIERFFRILSQNGLIMHQQRVEGNLSLSAEERYARFRDTYPGLEQRIAQKQIAAYLGITPVFLSMIRGKKTR